jgi:hypothetical protein
MPQAQETTGAWRPQAVASWGGAEASPVWGALAEDAAPWAPVAASVTLLADDDEDGLDDAGLDQDEEGLDEDLDEDLDDEDDDDLDDFDDDELDDDEDDDDEADEIDFENDDERLKKLYDEDDPDV